MAVKVQFEIGHTSKLRAKKTAEGFTHDWELYVKGVGRAEISIFVEKVVFTLHASFAKPKRAMKEPPYVIQESGYAGFILPIDIYFRNREEPKRVQFTYDLDLQQTGPPHHRFEVKKFIFDNPSDEFRQKLIKGGGVPVAGVVSRTVLPAIKPSNMALTDIDARTTMSIGDSALAAKQKLSTDAKKHKPRHKEESKTNSFANLFGTPIKTNLTDQKQLNENTASRSDSEKFSKEKEYVEKNREKSDKNDLSKLALQKAILNKLKNSTGANSKPEKSSESEKSKHKLHEKERNKRDKLENVSGSGGLPKQAHSPMKAEGAGRAEDIKKEQVDNVKQSDKKSKKDKKDKERKREGNDEKHFNVDRRASTAENQTGNTASPLQKAISGSDEKKIVAQKEKKASLPDNSTQSSKAAVREEKSHKYKKKVKSKDMEREKNHDKIKKTVKKSTSSKDLGIHKGNNYMEDSLAEGTTNARSHEKSQRKEKSSKLKSSSKSGSLDENKKSDSSSLDANIAEKNDMPNYQNNTQSNHSSSLSTGLPVSEESSCSSFQESSSKYFNKKSKEAKEQSRSNSSSHRSQATVEAAERDDRKRANENAVKLSFLEPPTKQAKREQNTKSPECHTSLTPVSGHRATEYINELQELHKKIIALQDDDLQQVVELIASTGCYEITTKTFDFDLCRLNQNVVQRLQEILSNSNV